MKPRTLPTWEVERIKARIEKAKRRIAAGYILPDKRGESEEDRLLRLQHTLDLHEQKQRELTA